MYSDVCISDFDSEDEDIAWSFQQCNNDESINISSTSSDMSMQNWSSEHVHEFGNFEENYGWIHCQSKTYPGRVYYHNTHSGCNTWYRPISRHIDIPLNPISIRRKVCMDDETMNDLELMAVSDHEKEPVLNHNKEPNISTIKDDGSLIEISDVIKRYYYTPQVDLTSNMDNSNDSCDSIDVLNECDNKEEKIDPNKNIISDSIDDLETEEELLCATNFLETTFFVEESEVLIKSPLRKPHVTYRVPCIKKLNFEDHLIKKKTCIFKNEQSEKIIYDMYGVRTINYNLPDPIQKLNEIGIKSSRLSESESDDDSDISKLSPLQRLKMIELVQADVQKNLRQSLLSDSKSSMSDMSSSTSQSTSSTSSCFTCCSSDEEI